MRVVKHFPFVGHMMQIVSIMGRAEAFAMKNGPLLAQLMV